MGSRAWRPQLSWPQTVEVTILMRLSEQDRMELEAVLAPFISDELVRSMASFRQHGTVSTLDHCYGVCEMSWWICRRLHIRADMLSLAVGALLHDFYLYDWHGAGWRHSYRHAEIARHNAVARFGVDERTQDVIACHMWPIGMAHVPHTREAVVVCVADKLVSIHETLRCRKSGRRACC